ncbi:hypothetical protein Plhal703r1_c04g0023541 [Plasmopara halstedii]
MALVLLVSTQLTTIGKALPKQGAPISSKPPPLIMTTLRLSRKQSVVTACSPFRHFSYATSHTSSRGRAMKYRQCVALRASSDDAKYPVLSRLEAFIYRMKAHHNHCNASLASEVGLPPSYCPKSHEDAFFVSPVADKGDVAHVTVHI